MGRFSVGKPAAELRRASVRNGVTAPGVGGDGGVTGKGRRGAASALVTPAVVSGGGEVRPGRRRCERGVTTRSGGGGENGTQGSRGGLLKGQGRAVA